MLTLNDSAVARFWSKVDKSAGPDACWPWSGYRSPKGYGSHTGPDRKPLRANRVAWALTNGDIPTGLCVCHSCDNPPCCNPAHLWIGTHADNAADRNAKNRQGRGPTLGRRRCGEECPASVLDAARVLAIRARHAAGGVTLSDVGREFGVHMSTVWQIVNRKTWRHI